jgi:hypothetical protein
MLVAYRDTISARLRAGEDYNKVEIGITNDKRIGISNEG